MVDPFLDSASSLQRVLHRKFWKDLRLVKDQQFNDPLFIQPSDETIAKDRLLRKMQVTDGLKVLTRLFSQLSILLCSGDCEPEKLATFKGGLKTVLAMNASMNFHSTKSDISFTPIAMLNITIHLVRFMRVSYA